MEDSSPCHCLMPAFSVLALFVAMVGISKVGLRFLRKAEGFCVHKATAVQSTFHQIAVALLQWSFHDDCGLPVSVIWLLLMRDSARNILSCHKILEYLFVVSSSQTVTREGKFGGKGSMNEL